MTGDMKNNIYQFPAYEPGYGYDALAYPVQNGRMQSSAQRKAERVSYDRRRERERRRRARQVRREYTILLVMVAGILFGCFAAFGFRTSASNDNADRKFKYYQNVTVSSEETLDDLAVRYADPEFYHGTREYLEEVAQINHLPVSEDGSVQGVTPGTSIIVPYYEADFVQ